MSFESGDGFRGLMFAVQLIGYLVTFDFIKTGHNSLTILNRRVPGGSGDVVGRRWREAVTQCVITAAGMGPKTKQRCASNRTPSTQDCVSLTDGKQIDLLI